ncbi:MAG TPA: sigma-54 dependent transcriptional regulator [Gemmataceae bacterium]|jgi:DNA-binding NtrC family response regulator
MMSSNRVALVTDDSRLACSIQTHLKKTFGQPVFQCGFDSIRTHLGQETDGLLLLAAASTAESEHSLRLVREIHLRQLPPIVMIVADEEAGDGGNLKPYVAQYLHWPRDAARLTKLIHDRIGGVREFLATDPAETITQVISRRLLTQTPSLLPLVERLALAAAHDVTVLLTGETGTGKTHLARLMHDCSPRRERPFLTVPCGAQPANLIESAFFGHVKGAFTGADRAKIGKFEAAADGSILLDEIDTLGLEQQAGLLRVLETGEFEPVGSNETRLCAARILVASNLDLENAVTAGKFRQDLYYRLNVMSFHLPPLRERVQDIAPLARALAARFNTKFGKELFDVSPQAMRALEAFPWPGNIRQMENFIQQAVLVSNGPELLLSHLPQQVRDHWPSRSSSARARADSLSHNRERVERNIIQQTLVSNSWNRVHTATALGISRVTLYKKMKKYGLMPSANGDGHA